MIRAPDGRRGAVFCLRLTAAEREKITAAIKAEHTKRSGGFWYVPAEGIGSFIRRVAIARADELLAAPASEATGIATKVPPPVPASTRSTPASGNTAPPTAKPSRPRSRPAGKRAAPGRRGSIRTGWSTDDAGPVPRFVRELTGLTKRAEIVARWGPGARFDLGLPTPKPAPAPKRAAPSPPITRKRGKR